MSKDLIAMIGGLILIATTFAAWIGTYVANKTAMNKDLGRLRELYEAMAEDVEQKVDTPTCELISGALQKEVEKLEQTSTQTHEIVIRLETKFDQYFERRR